MDGRLLRDGRRPSGGQDGCEAPRLRCNRAGAGCFQKSAPCDASHVFLLSLLCAQIALARSRTCARRRLENQGASTAKRPTEWLPGRNAGRYYATLTQTAALSRALALETPPLAQSGHSNALNQCPLLGVKRTSVGRFEMLMNESLLLRWCLYTKAYSCIHRLGQ